MKSVSHSVRTRATALILSTGLLVATSGCATLAHVGNKGQHVEQTAVCTGNGEVCPWLIGDAAWLFAGIIPGVVAFVVDFGSGSWKHHDHGDSTEMRTVSQDESLDDA